MSLPSDPAPLENQSPETKALLLFSGGQDSTICLAWALEHYSHVETIGFHYGQRHHVEMQVRQELLASIQTDFPEWAKRLGEDHVLDLRVLGDISDTSLTSDRAMALSDSGLPNSFVPGRNLAFFTLAAALAYRRNIAILIGGMCETDFSGYPDCRRETLDALALSLCLGMDYSFKIETPLMNLSKAQSWHMAQELGGDRLVEIVRVCTHSCYLGERGTLWDWGYGCASCPACELRAKGWREFRAPVE